MQICNCQNPSFIYNKYINERVLVKCGKCPTCQENYAKKWVDRLMSEASNHKFVYVLYLTYCDDQLPTYDMVGDYLVEQQERFFSRFEFPDVALPINELKFNSQADIDYFSERISLHETAIPHGSVRDIQNFKKRLNKYLYNHATKKYENFRSFIVCEYGPTTFRPHYHGLLFFDDPRICDVIEKAVISAWPFYKTKDGKVLASSVSDVVSCRPSRGGHAKYIAQYLNQRTNLPSLYSHTNLRPFFLCSRNPPIGMLLESSETLRQVFDNCSPTRVGKVFSENKYEFAELPLQKCVEDRIFPKCPFYSSLTHYERVSVYGCAFPHLVERLHDGKVLVNHRPFHDFRTWYDFIIERTCKIVYDSNNLADFERSVFAVNDDFFSQYFWKYSECFSKFTVQALRSLYRLSRRVYFYCNLFGVSLDEYVTHIEKYYINKDYECLSSQYKFQEKYSVEFGSDDLVFMYPLFCDSLARSHGVRYIDILSHNCRGFQDMCFSDTLKWKENHKTSNKNAYFEKLRQKDEVLFNLINNYNYAKKRYEASQAFSELGKKQF